MPRLFGTDGVRGRANVDVTAELALDLSVAAAHVLGEQAKARGNGRLRAVVGRDPRISGEFLSAAVCAGFASAGIDVEDLGVLPTPAVAYLVGELGADLGVMLSASHNPMPDNGIKFFTGTGHKLADHIEDRIETRRREEWDRPTGADVGRISRVDALERYVDHLVSTITHRLDGLKVVVDCAHGAASLVGPRALEAAGAEVIVIGAEPDGLNINDGYGSTHLEKLQAAVLEHGADAGVAYDGDADRCLAVDAEGTVVDGDQIMGILALALDEHGALADRTLVATVMSNLGLHLAMREAGITLRTTAVGDRYVLEDMQAGHYNLGGEQSGHVLLTDHATTGDGTLTSLHLLSRVAETGQPLGKLAAVVNRLPQVLVNVKDVDKSRAGSDEVLGQAVAEAETELGETGRVLLRSSGTEPLVRVMVEAASQDQAQAVAERLAGVVKARLAL